MENFTCVNRPRGTSPAEFKRLLSRVARRKFRQHLAAELAQEDEYEAPAEPCECGYCDECSPDLSYIPFMGRTFPLLTEPFV